jgi:hypothetical protein
MRVDNGNLFQIGEPDLVEFFAQGRIATRAEVDVSVTTGLPLLEEAAKEDGQGAIRELAMMQQRFETMLKTAVMT